MFNIIRNRARLFFFRRKWRNANRHNSTVPRCVFPLQAVSVGNMTYGDLTVKAFDTSKEKLVIGNYVSIAQEVVFILGGNHQVNTITPFPLYSSLLSPSPERDAQNKGHVIIEDEAWIGFGVIILSGVTIGKGAIVAAGSVVVKNVEPYSIVGGNPASFIAYRFDEPLRKELNAFTISQLGKNVIIENIELFYKPLTSELLQKIKSLISKP